MPEYATNDDLRAKPKNSEYATNKDLVAVEDNMLVEPDEWVNKTAGGIFLADVSEERPSRGTVIAVGPGKVAVVHESSIPRMIVCPMDYAIGDRVIFTKFGGNRLNLPGQKELYVLKPEHILAKIARRQVVEDGGDEQMSLEEIVAREDAAKEPVAA